MFVEGCCVDWLISGIKCSWAMMLFMRLTVENNSAGWVVVVAATAEPWKRSHDGSSSALLRTHGGRP